jgi:hypothetical protein
MRKYFEMKMLGKIEVGFVLQKMTQKQGIKHEKECRKGEFWGQANSEMKPI